MLVALTPTASVPLSGPARRWVGKVAAGVLLVAWFAALAGTGSGVVGTARWGAAVVVGVLAPGFALTRAVRRAGAPLVEDFAWAAPAGCLVALFGWLLDRLLPFPVGAYGLGPLLVVVLVLVPNLRRRVLARPAPGWGPGPAVVLAVVQLVAIGWMLRTGLQAYRPDPGQRGTVYYPDLMYNLSLAGELRHHIMPAYPPVAGTSLSYHWFLFAITDHLTTRTGVGLFDATLRLGPASAVPATLMLTAVVARRLADRIWAGPLAAVLLGAVELTQATRWSSEDGSLGMLPRAWFSSTPQALGWVAGLAVAGTVIAALRRGPADGAVPVALLAPFAVLAAGSKSAELVVVLGGLVVALVAATLQRHWLQARRALVLLAGAGVVFEAASRTIYGGSSYGVRLRWFAAPLDRVAQLFPGYWTQVSPFFVTGRRYDSIAVWTETALWVLPLLPRLAGLVFLLRYRGDSAAWFCAGAAAVGIGLALVTGHPAGSEVYFMQSGYPIGVTASAAGLLLGIDLLRTALSVRRIDIVAAAGALVAIGALVAATVAFAEPATDPVTRLTAANPGGQLWTVVPVWHLAWLWLRPTVRYLLTVMVLGALATVISRRRVVRPGAGVLTAAMTVLVLTLGGGVFDMVLRFHGTTTLAMSGNTAGADSDDVLIAHGALPTMRDAFSAGAYVDAHARVNDIVATNMYCRFDRAGRAATGIGCDARNFVASALTRRRTLLGGWAYADRNVAGAWLLQTTSYKDAHFWNPSLYNLEYNAIARPAAPEFAELYRHDGVRWLFVDLRDTPVNSSAIDQFATRRFLGPSTEVWQLRNPDGP